MSQYHKYACPNEECSKFNQFQGDNIKHRSWTGKNKDIERLRCTDCKKEFSSRKGTLRENAKISEEQQELLLKCFRWGVSESASADIANVTRKTVRLFQKFTAQRAQDHHDNCVVEVHETVVQCDEMHTRMQGGTDWIGIAMGATTLLILGITCGERNQKMADNLAAMIWAKCSKVPMLLTDGWACYWNAFLRCFGTLYRPRRKEGKGKKRAKALKIRDFFYAQVVKRSAKKGKRWSLDSVVIKALSGTLKQCKTYVRAYGAGKTINTSFVERLNATFRNCIAALRRKSRCSLKESKYLTQKVLIFVSLYNWVIPHSSLSSKQKKVTPAMAAGLCDHALSYSEYINLPVHRTCSSRSLESEKLEEMQSAEFMRASKRYKRGPIEEEVRWKEVEKEDSVAC